MVQGEAEDAEAKTSAPDAPDHPPPAHAHVWPSERLGAVGETLPEEDEEEELVGDCHKWTI